MHYGELEMGLYIETGFVVKFYLDALCFFIKVPKKVEYRTSKRQINHDEGPT